MNNNLSRGQTLIEVLVALGIATLLVSAISVSMLAALFNAQYSKNQNLATQYAQEGMEIVRKFRNDNFAAFNLLSGNPGSPKKYCLDKNDTRFFSRDATVQENSGCPRDGMSGQNVDIFARQVDIVKDSSRCGSKGTKVTVAVSWSDSKCAATNNLFCHKVQLVSCFSDSVVETP